MAAPGSVHPHALSATETQAYLRAIADIVATGIVTLCVLAVCCCCQRKLVMWSATRHVFCGVIPCRSTQTWCICIYIYTIFRYFKPSRVLYVSIINIIWQHWSDSRQFPPGTHLQFPPGTHLLQNALVVLARFCPVFWLRTVLLYPVVNTGFRIICADKANAYQCKRARGFWGYLSHCQ